MPAHPTAVRDLGYTAEVAEAFAVYRGAHRLGRVAHVDGAGVDTFVVDRPAATSVRATYGGALLADAAGDRARLPAVGDWAPLRTWPDGRITVEAVLPRRTIWVGDCRVGSSQADVLAANVDVVVVVEPLDPDPDLARIERLAALARAAGTQPVVALTKTERAPDAEAMTAEVSEVVRRARVIPVSVPDDSGVDDLAHSLAGATSVLVGASGAGKSSLLRALRGAASPNVTHLNPGGADHHVSATGDLVVIPGIGAIINTPGLDTFSR